MRQNEPTVLSASARRTAYEYEEMAGKFLLLVAFLWLLSNSMTAIALHIAKPAHDLIWVLGLTSHVTSLLFVGLIVGLTVNRKAPVDVQPGFEARISSFLGTFILLSLVAIPPSDIPRAQALVATGLIITGTLGSIWCLWWLGRAFAVMAAARNLVTCGPYARVRHPLYTAEAITVMGVILFNGSLAAVLVGGLQFFFQYRRIVNEERVLERAFPEYAAYRARTPMILPRVL